MNYSKKNQKLPYFFYYIPIVCFSAIGLLSSIYLTITHYKNYTDISFSSICAITKAINCDTVAQSSYSILFSTPLAIWGLSLFSLLIFLIANLRKNESSPLWWPLFFISLTASFISTYYGYISAVKIKSYCIFCLLCYASFYSLTFYSFIIIKRFNIELNPSSIKQSLTELFKIRFNLFFLFLYVTCLILIFTILPSYWKLEITPSHTKIKQGITEEGHPWIGASNPEITIHEFTDYMCFQCYKMHFFLRNVLSEYPDKIRLVHHNFPLDHEVNPILVPKDFHVGSGKLALIAIKAIQLNKFWEMNDILYQAGRRQGNFNIAKLASEAGIKNSASTLAQYDDSNAYQTLEHDIREGLRNNITSTPSYIIKGVTYTGTLPVTLFQNLAAKPTRKP